MSRRRRRASTGPPKCRDCRRPIVFHRSWTGKWRTFEPSAVDGRTHVGPAVPVVYGRAWLLEELVDELMVRHQYGRAAAEDEAYDVPWYVPHSCTNHLPITEPKAEVAPL